MGFAKINVTILVISNIRNYFASNWINVSSFIFGKQLTHQILTNTIYSGYNQPIRSLQIQYIGDTADPSDPYKYNIFGIHPTHQIITNTIYSGYSRPIAVSFFACKPVFQFYNVCFLNDTPSMERYGDARFTTVTLRAL